METERFRVQCGDCFGLCCTALAFSASSDFGHDKPEATPCRNLDNEYRCRIHDRLRPSGYKGCTVYDCFGAGQQISQVTFQGIYDETTKPVMYALYPKMVHLQEMMWYLTDGIRPVTRKIHPLLEDKLSELDALTRSSPDELAALDLNQVRATLLPLLAQIEELVQTPVAETGKRSLPRDWIGKNLAGQDFSGLSVRGQFLLATNLSNSRLRGVNFLGADLRDCQLAGADLTDALFLTQAQVNAAQGDAKTRLPERLLRPSHWA